MKETIVTMGRLTSQDKSGVDTDGCLCIWANVYLLVRPLA